MSFRLPANMLRTNLRTPTRQLLATSQRRFASTEPEGITFSSKANRPSAPKYEAPETGREYMAANRSGAVSAPAPRYVDGVKQEESFAGPSRPRMVYDRPKEARPLPQLKSNWVMYTALATLGLGAWAAFLLHATNAERLSSSVLRQITYQLRNSDEIKQLLGDRVHYAKNWYGFGEPWISGTVNLRQGKVDLKFRIEGSKEQATVYFTSIRPTENSEFQIVRYKVIADDGKVIQLA